MTKGMKGNKESTVFRELFSNSLSVTFSGRDEKCSMALTEKSAAVDADRESLHNFVFGGIFGIKPV